MIKSFPERKKNESIVSTGYDEKDFGDNYWMARNIKGNRRIDRDAKSLREFIKALVDHHILIQNPRVCDIGCGPGNMVMDFRNNGFRAEGCEFSKAAIRLGKQHFGIDIPFCDLRDTIPFPDQVFDFAYCVGVMTMVPRDKVLRAASEMHRIVKRATGLLHVLLLNPVQTGPRAGNEPHLTAMSYDGWRGSFVAGGFEDVTSLWAPQRHGIGLNNEYCALFRAR